MLSMIGFEQALSIVLSKVPVTGTQALGLQEAVGRVLCEDVPARVDLPGSDVSLKDGYAVVSSDIMSAGPDSGVELTVLGNAVAGEMCSQQVQEGGAIRITTGAMIPEGADAVLAEEFCERKGDSLICFADAHPGRNILQKGTDIKKGKLVLGSGRQLMPADVGLLAAAGIDSVNTHARPIVSILATGNEVVAPGKHLGKGKLFASNLVEISAWLTFLGMEVETRIVSDDRASIRHAIEESLMNTDALITTGGAWTSERDLLVRVLDEMAWQGFFHRVRLGPGKGVAFGLLEKKPVFCLPGGPPSNEMALLQLAIPGILKMQGIERSLFPLVPCVLLETVRGQRDWTQFVPAMIEDMGQELGARPFRLRSRLQSMADKMALIKIPEGTQSITEGELIHVQSVRSASAMHL